MLPPLAHSDSINDSESGVGRGSISDDSFFAKAISSSCRSLAGISEPGILALDSARIGIIVDQARDVAALHEMEPSVAIGPFDVLRAAEQSFGLISDDKPGRRSIGARGMPKGFRIPAAAERLRRTAPETRPSAVPSTISISASPPATGSRVNKTPAYSACTMRCTSMLPYRLDKDSASRVASNEAMTLAIAASRPSRSTLITDLKRLRSCG